MCVCVCVCLCVSVSVEEGRAGRMFSHLYSFHD